MYEKPSPAHPASNPSSNMCLTGGALRNTNRCNAMLAAGMGKGGAGLRPLMSLHNLVRAAQRARLSARNVIMVCGAGKEERTQSVRCRSEASARLSGGAFLGCFGHEGLCSICRCRRIRKSHMTPARKVPRQVLRGLKLL